MTTPYDVIGPQHRPTDDDAEAMPTAGTPWRHPASRPAGGGAPLAVAAVVNTLWATLLCVAVMIALVMLGRVSLGQRPNGTEVTVALAGWLLAHGVPIKAAIGQIGLAPLTVGLLAAWRLNRAGVHTARGIGARDSGSVSKALVAATAIGVVYGIFGLVTAHVISKPGMQLSPGRAGAHLLVIGTLAGLIGSLRTTDALHTLARATPMPIRDGLRTGVIGALLLLGIGAGLWGLAVALSGAEAVQLFAAFPSGVAGQVGVTLVCLAYAPNLATWAAAYLLGPGFVIGSGTIVRAGGVVVGEMPPLPVLAGVPNGPLPGPAWLLMALPVLVGLLSGLLLVRRRLRPRRTRSGDTVVPEPRWGRMLGAAVFSGPVAGAVLGAATLAAGGRLDGGQAFPVGSVAWQTALAATVAIGLGAVLGVVASFGRRRTA
jgi:hypothetical protein